MKNRLITSMLLLIGTIWLSVTLIVSGIQADSLCVVFSGICVFAVGALFTWMRVTYRDSDKNW